MYMIVSERFPTLHNRTGEAMRIGPTFDNMIYRVGWAARLNYAIC